MNIYYNPEEFELEIVDSLQEDLSYAFNILLVLRHKKTNRIYYVSDSGCSCPTPFEDYKFNSPEDHNLNEIFEHELQSFENVVNDFPASMDERQDMISMVKDLLSRRKRGIT